MKPSDRVSRHHGRQCPTQVATWAVTAHKPPSKFPRNALQAVTITPSRKPIYYPSGRPQDSFGLGAYYYDLSDVLEESLSDKIDFRDESAAEIFYSYSATAWLSVGADLQYIKPARGSSERALVAALRTQIRF